MLAYRAGSESLKFLTDFDGVLTDLQEEARRVKEIFFDSLVSLTDGVTATQLLVAAESQMQANPHRHGWRSSRNRITAFSNEDGFIFVNGLAACLDNQADEQDGLARSIRLRFWKKTIRTFSEIAQSAYLQMTKETAAGKLSPMDPGAGQVLKCLIDRGHSIVVVSNSGTERIERILSNSVVGPELETSSPRIRIRGNAQKFFLGNADDQIQSELYQVFIDRPHYHNIVLEESPDVVIGDVFSLDLALPLALCLRANRPLRDCRLLLRRRIYTPAWSIEMLKSYSQEVPGGILEHFDEIVDLA